MMLKIGQRLLERVFRSTRDQELKDHSAATRKMHFGSLHRITPISRHWGYDRGVPIDRHYIENFLSLHAADVRGHVLEIGDDSYARQFGGSRVAVCDVLDVSGNNSKATIMADLTRAEHIASDIFDCIILTQTLHLIYDVRATIKTLNRLLKLGGILLATTPGITRISHSEWADSWFWGFTSLSARRLFEEVFPATSVQVASYGNVLAASAFLYGLAVEDLRPEELNKHDPDYEICITVRAVKSEATL